MAVIAPSYAVGGSRPSPCIWSRFQSLYTGVNSPPSGGAPELGFIWHDDFLSFADTYAVASNVGRYAGDMGGYRSYEDTGDSIAASPSYAGGVIEFLTDTTDNDEVWLQGGAATGVLGSVSNTAGAVGNVLTGFECRFRTASVATGNLYVGMAEEGVAAADFITDGGAMITTKDLLGFYVLEGALTTLKFTSQKASQTAVTITMTAALAADTWYKAGFLFDPEAPTTKRLKVYLDAVENATGLTGTQLDAAAFPGGEEMHAIMGVKNSTTTAKNLLVDWIRFGQRLLT